MKANRDFRSMVVVLLVLASVTVAVVGLGCIGGGDETSPTAAPNGAGASTSVAATTTLAGSTDPLSSFKSKNPFIAQAQATTTIARTTLSSATTIRVTTTVRLTTTTAPHRLTVTGFPGGGLVNFTLDGTTLSGFGAGPAVFQGPWGSIQIIAVNDTTAPYTATFRRIGYTPDIVLPLNGYKTW